MSDERREVTSSAADGYEKKDASVAWIASITVLIVAVITVFAIGLNEYFLIAREKLVFDSVLSLPSSALRDLRAAETQALTTYKVLNADSGRYQIPIERAMKLMADEAYQARLDKTKK